MATNLQQPGMAPPVINPTESDPLAQLRDIHLPNGIESFPPAPGWWLLAALVLAALAWGLYRLYRYWRGNAYRREALRAWRELRAAYDAEQDAQKFLVEINNLLKRTALAAFERERVASVTGEAWVSFLDETLDSREFTMGPGQVLVDGGYAPAREVDAEALGELARHWIARHHKKPSGASHD